MFVFLLYETIYLIKVSKKTPLLYRDLRMSKELVVLSTILSNKEAKFNVITKLIDRLVLYKELLYQVSFIKTFKDLMLKTLNLKSKFRFEKVNY